MPAAVPAGDLIHIHQSEVGLVDQTGRLEGLTWFFSGKLLGCQLAQLVVDERQELLGSLRIALVDCGEDAGDFDQGGTTRLAGGSVLLTI